MLLLEFAELGILLHDVLEQAVDSLNASRDLVANATIDVLLRLDLNGPMRPGEIISITGLTSGGVTKLLDRLESDELIQRRYGKIPGDARGVEVRLTPTGARTARGMALAFAQEIDAVKVFVKELNAMLPDMEAG